MPNYLRAFMERASEGKPGDPIRFIAASEGVKRDGLNLKMKGVNLEPFRANPTFLWSHDYAGTRPPIGRVTRIEVQGEQMIADVVFDQSDDFARQIESKYRNGFLNAVSIGWDTHEQQGRDVTRWEVLDLSAVNVPGDPVALMERQAAAIRALRQEIEEITAPPTDDEPAGEDEPAAPEFDGAAEIRQLAATFLNAAGGITSEPVWRGVATAMVDLFAAAGGPMEEAERTRLYHDLARLYKRLGKEAPEYLTAAEVAPLSETELRGLFLEGEYEQRAGAVLSTRNRNDLEEAGRLIAAVLERSRKEEPAQDSSEEEEIDEEEMERAMALLSTLSLEKSQ